MGWYWRLFATITSLFRSVEGTYHRQVCIVVLGAHLVLSELAVCVCYGAWSTPGAIIACYMCVFWCLEHTWCYQSLLYVCVMVLGAHLVLSELAVCVCYGAWSTPGAIRACCMCMLWCLEHT